MCVCVQVLAVDGGDPALTGSAVVIVSVLDVDDNVAEFTEDNYQMSVPENSAVGVVVGHVTAVDDDLSPYNVVYYELLDDDTNSFHIDRLNGQYHPASARGRAVARCAKMTQVTQNTSVCKYVRQ